VTGSGSGVGQAACHLYTRAGTRMLQVLEIDSRWLPTGFRFQDVSDSDPRGEITMKNLIGGLFETQEHANQAYEALQNSGFVAEDINMFIHKPRNKTIRSTEVSLQEIAKNAFVGGLIGGAIGGFFGFLVGTGTISLPYLDPGSTPREPLFVFMSVVWGVI
jgi:hypothetical protein